MTLTDCEKKTENSVGIAAGLSCVYGSIALGATIGYVAGSVAGVYNYGNDIDQQSSLLSVMAFDLIGMGAAIALLNVNDGATLGLYSTIGSLTLLPVAGALLGYYIFREPADSFISRSLINLSKEKTSLSLPVISLNSANIQSKNKLVPTVSLLSIQL